MDSAGAGQPSYATSSPYSLGYPPTTVGSAPLLSSPSPEDFPEPLFCGRFRPAKSCCCGFRLNTALIIMGALRLILIPAFLIYQFLPPPPLPPSALPHPLLPPLSTAVEKPSSLQTGTTIKTYPHSSMPVSTTSSSAPNSLLSITNTGMASSPPNVSPPAPSLRPSANPNKAIISAILNPSNTTVILQIFCNLVLGVGYIFGSVRRVGTWGLVMCVLCMIEGIGLVVLAVLLSVVCAILMVGSPMAGFGLLGAVLCLIFAFLPFYLSYIGWSFKVRTDRGELQGEGSTTGSEAGSSARNIGRVEVQAVAMRNMGGGGGGGFEREGLVPSGRGAGIV